MSPSLDQAQAQPRVTETHSGSSEPPPPPGVRLRLWKQGRPVYGPHDWEGAGQEATAISGASTAPLHCCTFQLQAVLRQKVPGGLSAGEIIAIFPQAILRTSKVENINRQAHSKPKLYL